jgi:hypothetical protein
MKLFQQMLLAGASLSILAPVAAQASDVINLEEMNSYARSESKSSKIDSKTFINEVSEDIANLKGRVDGLEVQQNEFEAGGFSDTTTLDQKAVFALMGTDHSEVKTDGTDSLSAAYQYTMNLNTSFTGDDNLYVRLRTGNSAGNFITKDFGTYLTMGTGNGDILMVDKIWYTFPVGESNTVWLGPKIENYYMHGTTPSIYKPVLKAFTLGGNAAAYGASTGPGAGWSYSADNGFAVSSNFTTQKGNTNTGMLGDDGKTSWATQVGFTKPQYSVSAILNQKYNGWTDSYFKTDDGSARPGDGNSTNIGLRGWWRPESTGTATPSISVGYDTSETDATGNSNTTAYFVGLTWQDIFNADDRIGIAFGQPQKHEDDTVDPFLYEVYYDYKVNDSVTVTPAIFGGTSSDGAGKEVDMTGYVVNTTFKF